MNQNNMYSHGTNIHNLQGHGVKKVPGAHTHTIYNHNTEIYSSQGQRFERVPRAHSHNIGGIEKW